MRLVEDLKAVSTLVAIIVLIGITVSGGIATYMFFTSSMNVASQKTQVNFEYLALYKSAGEPKVVFAATLKNTGNKPIVQLTIRLHNESAYTTPSVSPATPLEPGMCTSIVLTPPQINASWYIVGDSYSVAVIEALASDGSTFTTSTTAMCMGMGAGQGASSVWLTILANPSLGTTSPPRGTHEYPAGSVVTVSATPASGWKFLWWVFDGEQYIDNPIQVLMDNDHALSAFFINETGLSPTDAAVALARYNGLFWFNSHWLPAGFLKTRIFGSGGFTWSDGLFEIRTGATSGSYASAYKILDEDVDWMTWDKKRYFTIFVNILQITAQKFEVATGSLSPTVDTTRHVGFKIINNTLYGTVADGATESTIPIETLTGPTKMILRVELTPGEKATFFVNGVNKGSLTSNLPSGSNGAEYAFYAIIKNMEARNKSVYITDVRFVQEL